MSWRTASRWALLIVAVLGLGGFYGWYLMLSPQGHTLPPDPEGFYLQDEHAIFAYGTLTSPLLRWVVLGEAVPAENAVLQGYRRDGLNLVASAGEQVTGDYFEVSGSQLRRLDRYERLGSRYSRTQHQLLDGREAWVYRRMEE